MFAARCGAGGFVNCFGASTVTGGSVAAEPVGICDAAGPHTRTVDKTATVEGTTRLDDNLMTMSFPNPGRKCRSGKCTVTYIPDRATEG
ncbi:hypothetical protein BDS110ZK4_47250 [Bradyrhizobium diazoefficiens]|uniref:Uncharacterized protein n=1 Tax=Bradyrhizobium diazoefficiens TaxID=1355477 RepID=A0A809ZEN5_9BRAD|nr:hypothetical protein XF1B_56670 [Bradyrhizobium diazoefficiens]BCE49250.1 hypothetical protein XF4B_55990 [Bradyrhizobium diazoefficiens]BCF27691.1 hypothetical protein XF14B_56430 [Bradyrhizobium diazoefficiens]